jgi:hypothetical protein
VAVIRRGPSRNDVKDYKNILSCVASLA